MFLMNENNVYKITWDYNNEIGKQTITRQYREIIKLQRFGRSSL